MIALDSFHVGITTRALDSFHVGTCYHLTPSSGFAAELASASTVVIASGSSLPVSTTHTLVGGVLGVGLARGLTSLNLRVVVSIFMSWIITLPAGAILSIGFFFMFKGMFS